MKVNFKGYNVWIKPLRSDRSFRVEIDVGLDEYDNIKEIPKLVEGVYEIEIKPDIKEGGEK
jgi:hypothetical protein